MKIKLVTILSLALSACGSQSDDILRQALNSTIESNEISQNDFDELLNRGRKPITAIDNSLDAPMQLKSTHSTTPHHLLSFDTTNMPSINIDDLMKYIKELILAYFKNSDISLEDLIPALNFKTNTKNDLLILTYERSYNGIPVVDAFIEFTFAKNGDQYKIYQIYDHSYGKIKPNNSLEQKPSFIKALSKIKTKLKQKSGKTVLLPVEADDQIRFYFTEQASAVDESTNDNYTIHIAHDSNEIIAAHKDVYSANTRLSADVYKRSHIDNILENHELPLARVEANGQSYTTNKDGMIELSSDVESAKITLDSQRVNVSNRGNSVFSINNALAAESDNKLKVTGDQLAALNAYTSIHRVNKFVRRYATENEVKLLKTSVNLTFNVSGNCNAFYQGGSDNISLFSAGGGCASMANVNDVIYHEWGHGLDNYTGTRGGITDGAFSEGIGDILAAYMTKSPNMGYGFFTNKSEGIRNLKNTKRYPQDRGEVHDEGEIIGGAFWDLHQALVERYGDNKGADMAAEFFIRHLLTTDKYTDSYKTVLALDDDDQNPSTPSPNSCLIRNAFANHGLAPEEQCEDPIPQSQNISVDQQMFLALGEEGKLYGSTTNTKVQSIAVCQGNQIQCNAKPISEMLVLDLEGAKDQRRMYVGDIGLIKIQPLEKLTLFGLDVSQKAISRREVKVSSK